MWLFWLYHISKKGDQEIKQSLPYNSRLPFTVFAAKFCWDDNKKNLAMDAVDVASSLERVKRVEFEGGNYGELDIIQRNEQLTLQIFHPCKEYEPSNGRLLHYGI